MSVAEEIPFKIYDADGSTTVFPLTFTVETQSNLIVTVNNIVPEVGQWSIIDDSVVFINPPFNGAVTAIYASADWR